MPFLLPALLAAFLSATFLPIPMGTLLYYTMLSTRSYPLAYGVSSGYTGIDRQACLRGVGSDTESWRRYVLRGVLAGLSPAIWTWGVSMYPASGYRPRVRCLLSATNAVLLFSLSVSAWWMVCTGSGCMPSTAVSCRRA